MLDKKVSRCLVMNDFLLSDRYVLVEGVTPIDIRVCRALVAPRSNGVTEPQSVNT